MSPAAVLFLAVLAAPTAPSARDASPRGRFIVGSPDRLASVGDRQHPRRYERVESAVGAYADVDELVDAIWLRHEVEGYARRAADCDRLPPGPCGQARRRLERATVIHVVRGEHAEMLWTSGQRAVRLGWRRTVTTPTGTMTVDEPPARFRGGARGRVSERSRPREPPSHLGRRRDRAAPLLRRARARGRRCSWR
jgi:hypothetical protein